MLQKLTQTLEQAGLLGHGRHFLVGLSGGADSVALTRALHAISQTHPVSLTIVHIHHGLRADESREDERFVKDLAKRLDLPVRINRVDVQGVAAARSISLEMAAREVRYAAFSTIARELAADGIMLAHTQDDQIETFLLKLARGAGLEGLSCMEFESCHSHVSIYRPMLDISRQEVQLFLEQLQQPWREDSSNASTAFLRNRVRNTILPLLERELNPDIRNAIGRTIKILKEENHFLRQRTAALYDDCLNDDDTLHSELLQRQPLPIRRRIVHQWLIRQRVPAECIRYQLIERLVDEADKAEGTHLLTIGKGLYVERSYQCISVKHDDAHNPLPWEPIELNVPGITTLESVGLTFSVTLMKCCQVKPNTGIGCYPAQACLSLKGLKDKKLMIRAWEPGDVLAPTGMNGHKKIQDIWVDQKVPRPLRKQIPLLTCEHEVLWLPGYSINRHHALSSDNEQCIQILVKELNK